MCKQPPLICRFMVVDCMSTEVTVTGWSGKGDGGGWRCDHVCWSHSPSQRVRIAPGASTRWLWCEMIAFYVSPRSTDHRHGPGFVVTWSVKIKLATDAPHCLPEGPKKGLVELSVYTCIMEERELGRLYLQVIPWGIRAGATQGGENENWETTSRR